MKKYLVLSLPPHIHAPHSTSWRMWQVVIALIPALLASLFFFGIGAAIVTATSVVACMACEYAITRWMLGRTPTLRDGSAALTGLLLALNLPSNLPVWLVVTGAFASIGIGKMAFGGLGCNIFNPALVGRVFLLLSFPVQMTSWPLPLENRLNYLDATTGATTLGLLKQHALEAGDVSLTDNLLGVAGGSLGEVCAVALLLGFGYLLVTRVITWHIPVAILAGAGAVCALSGADFMVEILSGGMLLGAIFMATDYVTSPMTVSGKLVYGFCIGLLVMVIRLWGSYPEGMSFAILILNGFTPLINRAFKPRRFGAGRRLACK